MDWAASFCANSMLLWSAPHTQAADGIRLARLVVQSKALSDLVENEVPRLVRLNAPVVTKANVDKYITSAFES